MKPEPAALKIKDLERSGVERAMFHWEIGVVRGVNWACDNR